VCSSWLYSRYNSVDMCRPGRLLAHFTEDWEASSCWWLAEYELHFIPSPRCIINLWQETGIAFKCCTPFWETFCLHSVQDCFHREERPFFPGIANFAFSAKVSLTSLVFLFWLSPNIFPLRYSYMLIKCWGMKAPHSVLKASSSQLSKT